jgi:hypothetical protein
MIEAVLCDIDSLRHKELLMVVRVVVHREHDEDRATQAAVDMIRHDSLKDRSLEYPIEPSLVAVEVVPGHRVALAITLWLLICHSLRVRLLPDVSNIGSGDCNGLCGGLRGQFLAFTQHSSRLRWCASWCGWVRKIDGNGIATKSVLMQLACFQLSGILIASD